MKAKDFLCEPLSQHSSSRLELSGTGFIHQRFASSHFGVYYNCYYYSACFSG